VLAGTFDDDIFHGVCSDNQLRHLKGFTSGHESDDGPLPYRSRVCPITTSSAPPHSTVTEGG
jgi:hypothetical protein